MNNIDSTANTYQFPDDDVSLKELLSPLWTRRWLIIFTTLTVGFVAAFYASLLKPQYQSSAILQIGSNLSANKLSINEAFSNDAPASIELIQNRFFLLLKEKGETRFDKKKLLLLDETFELLEIRTKF